MKQKSTYKVFNRTFIFSLIVYLFVGSFLIYFYQYRISPDGVSYISISQKYLHGNFQDAINGYWGPLFSWLLIPFLYLNIPPLLSLKILNLILGSLTLIGVKFLSLRFRMSTTLRDLSSLISIAAVLYFALCTNTPDLLITCMLIYYFYKVYDPHYSTNVFNAILGGFIGGMMYLSKSYGFYFFIVHFLIINCIHYINAKVINRKRVMLNFISGFVSFFLICGIWISLISDKYNYITVGTSGMYNHNLVGPNSKGNPHYYQGLLPPPNDSAISEWEDPSYLKMESWFSPTHQLKVIFRNLHKIKSLFEEFSIFSIMIILFYLLSAIIPLKKLSSRFDIIFPILTLIVYCGGYTLVLVYSRYIWICYILLMLMGYSALDAIKKSDFFSKNRKLFLVTCLSVSFLVLPMVEIIGNLNNGRDIYRLSNMISSLNVKGNIASNREWQKSLYLSFHLNWHYYGMTEAMTSQGMEKELIDNDIDYYLLWEDQTFPLGVLIDAFKLDNSDLPKLKIFAIQKDNINNSNIGVK